MSRPAVGAFLLVLLGATAPVSAEAPERTPPPLAEIAPRPEPVEAPAAAEIDAALARGVEFLVKRQEPNGAWGSPRNTKGLNIYAPVPGAHQAFRAAVTSLCTAALIETGDDDPRVAAALDRAEEWTFEHLPKVRRANARAIYNNWAHAYSIQALVRMHRRHADDPKRQEHIRGLIEQQIDLLGRYECVGGGWCYYDFHQETQRPGSPSASFLTAAVLVALAEARDLGVEVPGRLVERGTESIRRQRKPDFSYLYGEGLWLRPMYSLNRPGGSLGRSQACNVAMRLWGDELVTDKVLSAWLDRLFARNLWLDLARKRPIPHESWFAVAGYFFYFGHYYAALCIEQLPASQRGFYQDHLAAVLLRLQEKDGSWWDYPFYDYHQQYGTALALMTLARCRHDWKNWGQSALSH